MLATDPVCGMEVDPTTAAGMSEYGGKRYYFCAESCKAAFDAGPQNYLNHGPTGMPPTPSRGKRWWEFWKT